MFARFNHLGLCTGKGATRRSIDRIRTGFDNTVLQWKTAVADYLLLPSDTSTSITIPYEENISEQTIPMSVDSSEATDLLSPHQDVSPMISEQGSDVDEHESNITSSKEEHKGKFT